jgi:hypothetical protein
MSEQPDWSDEDDAISDAVFDALAVVWAAERAAGILDPQRELLEEIPWDPEEEALLAEAWDELAAELRQEAAVRVATRAERAAIAQRRWERRRRRAWYVPLIPCRAIPL